MSDMELFKRKVNYVIKMILLIIVVALLAIIAFSASFAFLFSPNTIKVTSGYKIITISTQPTQINVNLRAYIWFSSSEVHLELSNYDNRPYHFVKIEIMNTQTNTIVYTLKIDVTLPSSGSTSFTISIPANTLQQGTTYIITLYTDDGYKVSTTQTS